MSREEDKRPKQPDPSFSPMLRSLLIELAIYTPLILLYVLVVLRALNGYLTDLYAQNLTAYAIVATALILGQGVVLEIFTSWLIRRFGLRH